VYICPTELARMKKLTTAKIFPQYRSWTLWRREEIKSSICQESNSDYSPGYSVLQPDHMTHWAIPIDPLHINVPTGRPALGGHVYTARINMVKDQIRKVKNLVQTENAVTNGLRNPEHHISQTTAYRYRDKRVLSYCNQCMALSPYSPHGCWSHTTIETYRDSTQGKYRPTMVNRSGFSCHLSSICLWSFLHLFIFIYSLFGARGSVVGWGTMLQAGRSRVRVPMSLDSFNVPNPSSHIMAQGSTQHLTEMSTTNLPGG
jgi:hypothetical protein